MFIRIRLGSIMQIWKNKGIIDENNYAFLTGKSTTQPLMIKKMILEEVGSSQIKKKIALLDIDFSKAYNSTEEFAKDITLRRMGFPEEGLDLWQMYDCDRKMQVLTAYGLTDEFTPECGAWG